MISHNDRTTLRDLAHRVADIAALSIQAERREQWKQHNSLQTTRPMILVFPEGSWEELLTERDLICEGKVLREGTSGFLINDPMSRELYLGPRFSM